MDAAARQQAVGQKIHAALIERFGEEFEQIGPEDDLLEAGLDSVDLLDAVATIEKLFDLAFERDELIGIATLAELVEAVTDRLVEERGENFEV
jgi:acyl carrier protein